MSKLWCLSFNNFKLLVNKNNWQIDIPDNVVIISICNNIKFNESLKNEYYYEDHLLSGNNVINLDFDDINGYNLSELYDLCPGEYENVKGLTDEQSEQLFNFIDSNIGKYFYIHCSAGVSRSQAIVKFILDCYPDNYTVNDTNPDNPCEFPNLHVVSLLKNNFRKKYNIYV